MPKYERGENFSLGSFPEVGQKKRERERLNYGNNNGQLHIANATSGWARKATWANIMPLGKMNWCSTRVSHAAVFSDWMLRTFIFIV